MPYADPLDPRARAARRRHYEANRDQYRERNVAKKRQMRDLLRARKDVPCTDCGVKYPFYVMQFDHIGDDKEYTPSRLVEVMSVAKLEAELAKCEVVCANCHAERTYQRAHAVTE